MFETYAKTKDRETDSKTYMDTVKETDRSNSDRQIDKG